MKKWKHIEYLLRRRSFPDFIKATGCKADPKEWSECIAMMHRINYAIKDKKIDVAFDIGCGKRPTLGILIALNVKSINKVVCVDPQLDTSLAKDIKGIELEKLYLTDFVNKIKEKSISFGNVLICCNHSHAPKKEIYQLMDLCEDWIYITCPCCVDNKLKNGLYFKDTAIWSPKNEIFTFYKKEIS